MTPPDRDEPYFAGPAVLVQAEVSMPGMSVGLQATRRAPDAPDTCGIPDQDAIAVWGPALR